MNENQAAPNGSPNTKKKAVDSISNDCVMWLEVLDSHSRRILTMASVIVCMHRLV